MAARASSRLVQLVPGDYRRPEALPPGGVLVVGASASGLQIADELARAGRDVTIAAGQHTRVPRLYRGRDLFRWLDRLGLLRAAATDVYDLGVSRAQPSLQLVGRPTHDALDLRGLAARGVSVVGRLLALEGDDATFDDDLIASTAAADLKLAMLVRRIDQAAASDDAEPPPPFVPHWPAFIDARRHVAQPRPRGRDDGDLGHRLPPALSLAPRPGARRARRDGARRRRDARPRALRPRPPVPAAPQFRASSTGSASMRCIWPGASPMDSGRRERRHDPARCPTPSTS